MGKIINLLITRRSIKRAGVLYKKEKAMNLFNEDDEDEEDDEDDDDGWVEKEPQSAEEDERDLEVNRQWFGYDDNVGGL